MRSIDLGERVFFPSRSPKPAGESSGRASMNFRGLGETLFAPLKYRESRPCRWMPRSTHRILLCRSIVACLSNARFDSKRSGRNQIAYAIYKLMGGNILNQTVFFHILLESRFAAPCRWATCFVFSDNVEKNDSSIFIFYFTLFKQISCLLTLIAVFHLKVYIGALGYNILMIIN